jgi:hypothetical protein
MKHFTTTRTIFAALGFIFAANLLNAQPAKQPVRLKEIMLNSYISGNSFGVQRNPSIAFSIGNHFELAGGPSFNRGFHKNTGGLMSLRYNMVGDNESYNGRLRLSSIVTVQRMHRQSLSKEVVALEQKMAYTMSNSESASFCDLRYKGWETSAGVGFSYRCAFGMTMRAEVALCYYTTDRSTQLQLNPFHDENGTSLRLGFGIGWSFAGKAPITPPAFEYELTVMEQYTE